MAENKLDVLLAEYSSLRAEQAARIQIQFTSVTWLLTIIGAFSAALTFLFDKDHLKNAHWLGPLALEILPLAATPIAFMTFDHMIMVHRIGDYLSSRIRPQIHGWLRDKSESTEGVLGWDPRTNASAGTLFSMKYLFFPFGSWLLFLMVIPTPTVVVTVRYFWAKWPFPALLVIDWLVAIAFVYGSAIAWNERAGWLGVKKVRLPGVPG